MSDVAILYSVLDNKICFEAVEVRVEDELNNELEDKIKVVVCSIVDVEEGVVYIYE